MVLIKKRAGRESQGFPTRKVLIDRLGLVGQLELPEGRNGIDHDADRLDQLVKADVLVGSVEVVAAVAHVGRGQIGVLGVEHRPVGSAPDHLLGRFDTGLAVSLKKRHQEVTLGVDAVEVVDRGHVVAGHFDRAAEFLGDSLGHTDGVLDHLVGLVAVETARCALEHRLAGSAGDARHVEVGGHGVFDTNFRGGVLVAHLIGELHGRVLSRAQFVGGHTGMGIAAGECQLELPAVEAADVDWTETLAVHGQEHVPGLDQLWIEVLEAELTDLLVDADPQAQWTVLPLEAE